MREVNAGCGWSRSGNRTVRWSVIAAVAATSLLVARAWAGPEGATAGAKTEKSSEGSAAARVEPNYALEERFLPDQVG
jgi:hypothetical protein